MKWPVMPGRYTVNDEKNPVAVCTLKDVDIEIEKAGMYGPCNTENIGIERIIRNVVTNPHIRFLVLCGNEPKGHFVGQALKCLVKDGLEDGRKIVGAQGAMPFLKNATDEEIEQFKKQIEIVDLIGETDLEKITAVVEDCIKRNPGPFNGKIKIKDDVIEADFDHEKEMVLDKSGWFIISVDKQNNQLIVEHYMEYGKEARLHCKIVGKTVEEIVGTIVKKGLVSDLYHAAYLGKELQKAEIALRKGIEYEQDKKLEL